MHGLLRGMCSTHIRKQHAVYQLSYLADQFVHYLLAPSKWAFMQVLHASQYVTSVETVCHLTAQLHTQQQERGVLDSNCSRLPDNPPFRCATAFSCVCILQHGPCANAVCGERLCSSITHCIRCMATPPHKGAHTAGRYTFLCSLILMV